tara:strand:- start:696 stop:899 length:204 start_codon:yes stop_codon:yes gene_type:complete
MAKGDNYGFTVSFISDITGKRVTQGLFRTRKQAKETIDLVFKGKKYKRPRIRQGTKKDYLAFLKRQG